MAITSDGNLIGWGHNSFGQIGNGHSSFRQINPVMVLDDVISVSANGSTTHAITSCGTLWAWGRVEISSHQIRSNPVAIMNNVVAICGGNHSLAITADGVLWGWGNNFFSPLGEGRTAYFAEPIRVMDDVVSVSAGGGRTMAITSDGGLWGLGLISGSTRPAENGHTPQVVRQTPVRIMDDIISVSTGGSYVMAIDSNNSLWGWGLNFAGQLGNGTTINTPYHSPVRILENVIAVSVGTFHTMAITADGSLWAWGGNDRGQLGDGTNIDRYSPVKIMGDVIYVTTSRYNTAAITSDGVLWIWGDGFISPGNLNDNADSNIPVRVSGHANLSGEKLEMDEVYVI